MDRVDGRVPVDNPPYVFVGWFFDAAPAERRALQDATRARCWRSCTPSRTLRATFPGLAADVGDDALRTHVDAQRAYYEWTRREDGLHIPVIEDAFDWLEAHLAWRPGRAGPFAGATRGSAT